MLASGYSPVAGPGSGQAFSAGPLTAAGDLVLFRGTGNNKIQFNSEQYVPGEYCTITTQYADSNANNKAEIRLGIDNVDTHTFIAFCTTNTAGYVYERARINNAGELIIGAAASNGSGAKLQVAGGVSSFVHNTSDLGTTAVRWKDLWLQSGAFNGSDARLKTAVVPFTTAETQAAKELSQEIGTYQWLEAVAAKGVDQARLHTGLTVQRAIEIMAANGLDPFRYGFIGYDQWEDNIVEHPAVEAIEARAAQPAEYETQTQIETVIIDGVATELQRLVLVCTKEAVPAVEAAPAVPARTEVVLKAGDAYSFRYDQLNMFIARGFEARLAALEGAAI